MAAHPLLRRTRSTLLLLAAVPFFTACIAARRPIVLDSSPPGAEVYIDGVSSGHSTPCRIQLPDEPHKVEFKLVGYETETRRWKIGERDLVVFYMDGFTNLTSWPLPIFLSGKDFFFPVKNRDGEMPNRIHVKMTRSRDGGR
ncbi:MAG: PEGA domain-containing protein [Planctomycetota bacterium]|jgi:hypothetical protein